MGDEPTYEYDPDYVVAPGCTLKEWLDNCGFEIEDIALNSDHVQRYVLSVLNDILDLKPLGVRHSELLEDITGIPSYFWLNLEQNYRVGLEAGKHDISHDILRRD